MTRKSTTAKGRGKKRRKIQKNLQNKSKHKNNKCFSWVTAVRVLSLTGSHSPPHLPRMPSNTVLITGPAVRVVQILICSCSSSVFLPPVSTTSELVCVLLWELSMCSYIPQTQSLLSWSCGFNLPLVQLVGRFEVFFLSHTAPWVSVVVLFPHLPVGHLLGFSSWGCPGGLGFAPMRARCGGGAAAWVAGVLAAPGPQGSWWLRASGTVVV